MPPRGAVISECWGAYYLRPACEPRREDLGSDFEPGTGPPFTFARLYSRAALFSVPVSQLYFRRRHVYRSLSLASDLDEELSVCRYLCTSQGHLLQYDNSLNVIHDTIR